ncbi:MAG: phosphoribosylformylglycinamidine cyclo-ligase [Kiritimatiellae bacterium]|nr:phosphoribosylformylglycinamidine cyclo-ligase [Kiritimatiellia bacterium]
MAAAKTTTKTAAAKAQPQKGEASAGKKEKAKKPSSYASAGVDIDSKMDGIRSVKKMVSSTATKGSIGGIGNFGGLFKSPGADYLLVGSTDGVGTKLKVACQARRHTTVGEDLVNHCVNDILVQGAEPLFFLDYVGASQFNGKVFQEIVSGLVRGCRQNGCALLGGETAELPGVYPQGEYDLVGTIVGAVKKSKVITGEKIKAGDAIIGLSSGGLQTNGFTLARHVIFDICGLTVNDVLPGTRTRIGDALLATHRSFLKPVKAVLAQMPINGMAHITGGGFTDNIPRVLPAKCHAVIDRAAWKVPPIFEFIGKIGKVDRDEMYRVFNMGIGFVIIVDKKKAKAAMDILRAAKAQPALIGEIVAKPKGVSFKDEAPDDGEK